MKPAGRTGRDDMIDVFKERYGYDPVPYLPVLNGVVVGSPDLSDRFLWDLRRLVADPCFLRLGGWLAG